MSPQFVDFNADGNIDILAGTFAGSPYVALGNGKGFYQPKQILDRDGERILLNQFWNYETKKWDSTKRCDPDGGAPLKNGVQIDGHATSAWAMDWDQDGDLDLVLGDYGAGYLYLRLNGGTAQEAAFSKQNILIEADGKPINVGKVATMRFVDYDGDGLQDLVMGSMGNTSGTGTGGGVFIFANGGTKKSPRFGGPVTLIPKSLKGQDSPTRPDAGLYMDLVDFEGDGDLDVIVGAYSMWTPKARDLTTAEEKRVIELRDAMKNLNKRMQAMSKKLSSAGNGKSEAERKKAWSAALKEQAKERREIFDARKKLRAELDPMVPGAKRRSFVWLYENRTVRTGTGTWILPGPPK